MRARLGRALRRLAHRIDHDPTYNVRVVIDPFDGEALVQAIKQRNRRKGLGSAGI